MYINPLSIPCSYNPGFYVHPKYPGYSVDCIGNLFSYFRMRFFEGTLRKGYRRFRYYDEQGNQHAVQVHRLVAYHFVPLPYEFCCDYSKATVDHIDGNKLNNDYTNLEWVPREENNRRAWKTGLHDSTFKPVIVIDKISKSVYKYPSIREAERQLLLNKGLIKAYLGGNRKGYVAGRYIPGYADDPNFMEEPIDIERLINEADDVSWGKRPVTCVDIINNTISEYPSIAECSRQTGINVNGISCHLSKGSKTPIYKRYIITYKEK